MSMSLNRINRLRLSLFGLAGVLLRTFNVTAINLPARGGEITKAELLHCPNLIEDGITPASKVLYAWQKGRAGGDT